MGVKAMTFLSSDKKGLSIDTVETPIVAPKIPLLMEKDLNASNIKLNGPL